MSSQHHRAQCAARDLKLLTAINEHPVEIGADLDFVNSFHNVIAV